MNNKSIFHLDSMSNDRKCSHVAPAPDLKSIFEKVKEIASQSAASQMKKLSRNASTLKRLRDDGDAGNDINFEIQQQHAVDSCADTSAQSCSSSAVTITFGDCAENHVGAMSHEPNAAFRLFLSPMTLEQACRSWERRWLPAVDSRLMNCAKQSDPLRRLEQK
jgi:hypothetical protein